MSPNVAPSIGSENESRANGDNKADGRDEERGSVGSIPRQAFSSMASPDCWRRKRTDRAVLGKAGDDFSSVGKRIFGLIVGPNLAAAEFLAVHAIGIFDNRPVDRIP